MTDPVATITTLVDNNARNGLAGEHGFALWIETDGKRILFDTGQGGVLSANARALGVSLHDADFIVLSHGHYDHTGGLPRVLDEAGGSVTCCHPEVTKPRYSVREGSAREIGMPEDAVRAIENLPAQRMKWADEPLFLTNRIGVTGPIPRETAFEDTGGAFFLDPEGVHPDLIQDDIALWIRTAEGTVLCAGCSHAGIVNTASHVQRLTNGERIRAVIGGFHLLNAGRDRMEQTVASLRRFDIDKLVPCHCTGEHAVEALRDAFGERVMPGAAGMVLAF
ncbi:MAG TPA: MBL fold metallo-hydrolase [Candidatus Latescibacteria bacterium]|nr:MBL fold metallo-hydrolase [Candidatus Latescibacterota bacterium]HQI75317.1 MBL fold metallo-hydrolase [Candidatus Latescibacterota bacterium]HQK21952.1 MBL fold metallo-hydrolase [Candidatus Latescibacterota bacterium]